MQAIVSRHWEFQEAVVFRRWVPNCAVCRSAEREHVERVACGIPLILRGRGLYPLVLRSAGCTSLNAASIRVHFERRHHPLRSMTRAMLAMTIEAERQVGSDGVHTFDGALAVLRAERRRLHEADWATYLLGPQDDTRHLLAFRPKATRRNQPDQDPLRPSTRIRPEWDAPALLDPATLVFTAAGADAPARSDSTFGGVGSASRVTLPPFNLVNLCP
jgi:hypothetical protein